jgi:hypothetical protein
MEKCSHIHIDWTCNPLSNSNRLEITKHATVSMRNKLFTPMPPSLGSCLFCSQFVQWTFAGAPGHPVLANTVYRIARILAERSVEDVSTGEVTGVTGPTVFTDAVYEYMRSQVGGGVAGLVLQPCSEAAEEASCQQHQSTAGSLLDTMAC